MSVVFRRKEWRSMLRTFAEGSVGQPFVWGSTDGAALVRAALLVMFTDAIEPVLPPTWTTLNEAAQVFDDLESLDAMFRGLGAHVGIGPNFARAGDIIVQAEPEEHIAGVALMTVIDGTECLTTSHVDG